MVSLATAIGEETERLNVEEMEKSGERTLNSAGGGKLNAEINLEGENLAMDSGEKYWG